MELLLNLLWLFLAISLLRGYIRLRRTQGLDTGAHPFRAFVLCICIIILLFPVVSASDDLCALQTELGDLSAGQVRGKNFAGSSANGGKSFPQLIGICSLSLVMPCGNDPRQQVAAPCQVWLKGLRAPVTTGRAPPSAKFSSPVAPLIAACEPDLLL